MPSEHSSTSKKETITTSEPLLSVRQAIREHTINNSQAILREGTSVQGRRQKKFGGTVQHFGEVLH